MKKWIANTSKGEISEGEGDWTSIKDDIKLLRLELNGKTVSLPKDMKEYVQFKSASGDFSTGKIEVLSRVIGFKLGNNYIKLRVDEKTDDITVEVEEVNL